MYDSTTYPSPIGVITLACDCEGKSLVGLWMQGQRYHGAAITEVMADRGDVALFARVKTWLDQYFAGERPDATQLPLAPIGSPFRQEVWRILREIPYGEVMTYGAIAKKVAEKMGKTTMSSRAVGGAVGHNPISIIIPCHRVVGSNGSLTGFSGGVHRKMQLLALEGVDLSGMLVPKK
jgi:methylated-DNA-[protein]-cysteine S-methyltransferase